MELKQLENDFERLVTDMQIIIHFNFILSLSKRKMSLQSSLQRINVREGTASMRHQAR